MQSEGKLSRLIVSAYEAASEPNNWSVVLEQLAQAAKGAHAAILLNDYRFQQYNIAASHNVDPDAQRLYQTHYATIDAYYLRGKELLRTGWCGTSQMLISDSDLLASEFYQDYQRKYDMFHSCVAALHVDSTAISAITLLRSRRRGPFGRDQVGLLELLVPHLQAALRLHRRVVELRLINNNLEQAIHLTATPLILVNAEGQVIFASRAAESLLRAQDGLRVRENVLHADLRCESLTLRRMISGAANMRVSDLKLAIDSITLSRTSRKPPLTVTVAPLRCLPTTFATQTVAAVFVFDPLEKPSDVHDVLRVAFGFTPAESRLAKLMLEQRTLREAGERLRVSRNTVKTQMTSIFAKTNTSSQNQLAHAVTKLLSRLPAHNRSS